MSNAHTENKRGENRVNKLNVRNPNCKKALSWNVLNKFSFLRSFRIHFEIKNRSMLVQIVRLYCVRELNKFYVVTTPFLLLKKKNYKHFLLKLLYKKKNTIKNRPFPRDIQSRIEVCIRTDFILAY